METFFKNREFRWITISDWVSAFGDAIFFMAYMAFASTLDNSALAISLVTLSESIPDFTSFLTGYFCDRTKEKYKADIFCAFVRAILYIIVSCFFANSMGWVGFLIVLTINLISDILGNYSDNLRFPEIYAVVPNEEYESSAGFSMAIYYTIKICARMIGGAILIFLKYNYPLMAVLNAVTFIICGLSLLAPRKSVEQKMQQSEQHVEYREKRNIIGAFKCIFQSAKYRKVLYGFISTKCTTVSFLPIIYIMLANSRQINVDQYTLIVSLINAFPTIGIIAGNLFNKKLLGNFKLSSVLMMKLLCGCVLIVFALQGNYFFMVPTLAMLYFVHGVSAVRMNKFFVDQQKYENLGFSIGVTNTLLTLIPAIFLSAIMIVVNMTDPTVTFAFLLMFSVVNTIYIYFGRKEFD